MANSTTGKLLNGTDAPPDYDNYNSFIEFENRLEYASFLLTCIINPLGIINNLAFMFTAIRVSSMRTVSNYYLINLSIADLLFLGWRLILSIMTKYAPPNTFTNPEFCIIGTILHLIPLYTSILTVAIISVDRYLAICQPFFYQGHSAEQLYMRIIVGTWVSAFCLSVIYSLQLCFFYGAYAFVVFIYVNHYIILVISMSVVTVMYALTIHAMVIRTRHQTHAHLRDVAWNEMVQTIRLLVVTTLVFYITVVPYQAHYLIFFTLPKLGLESDFSFWYFGWSSFISSNLLKINSAINPTIYKLTSAKYRKAFVKAIAPCISIVVSITSEKETSSFSTKKTSYEKRGSGSRRHSSITGSLEKGEIRNSSKTTGNENMEVEETV